MAESLSDFRKRTAFVWDSLPREGGFVTSPGLAEKVDGNGLFRPFFGNTILFDLPDEDKAWLNGIRRTLDAACGELLAEPLEAASFHITLHDLLHATNRESIAAGMEMTGAASRALLAALPEDLIIQVKATAVFSMVNTSVVMGFEPADEENCAALMALYDMFQQVVPLSYPLTPHVTLAYYRPMAGGDETLRFLRSALDAVNRHMEPRTVRLTRPCYCTFTDMNHYDAADA